jgi:hypothetical protein
MSFIENSKKQISFSDFFSRILSLMIDMSIFMLTLGPGLKYLLSFYIKKLFMDFYEKNNIPMNDFKDFFELSKNEEYAQLFSQSDVIPKLLITNVSVFLFFILLYFVICWSCYGTTIGKYLLRMKVVDYVTGNKLTVHQSIVRFIFYIFAPLSIIVSAIRHDKRTIHDIVAGSVVIER